jgi:hypothetical protein
MATWHRVLIGSCNGMGVLNGSYIACHPQEGASVKEALEVRLPLATAAILGCSPLTGRCWLSQGLFGH